MNVGQFILQAARLNGKKILPQRDFFIRFNVLKNNQYHILYYHFLKVQKYNKEIVGAQAKLYTPSTMKTQING